MDELREAAWEFVARRTLPEYLPMAAAAALARGVDSPGLRELAGLGRRSDTMEIRDLFERATEELGIAIPSEEQVGRQDLIRLAEDLVQGRRSARETARLFYLDEPWMNSAENHFFSQCGYFDDLYDLLPADRIQTLETDLVESARAVIAAATPP